MEKFCKVCKLTHAATETVCTKCGGPLEDKAPAAAKPSKNKPNKGKKLADAKAAAAKKAEDEKAAAAKKAEDDEKEKLLASIKKDEQAAAIKAIGDEIVKKIPKLDCTKCKTGMPHGKLVCTECHQVHVLVPTEVNAVEAKIDAAAEPKKDEPKPVIDEALGQMFHGAETKPVETKPVDKPVEPKPEQKLEPKPADKPVAMEPVRKLTVLVRQCPEYAQPPKQPMRIICDPRPHNHWAMIIAGLVIATILGITGYMAYDSATTYTPLPTVQNAAAEREMIELGLK